MDVRSARDGSFQTDPQGGSLALPYGWEIPNVPAFTTGQILTLATLRNILNLSISALYLLPTPSRPPPYLSSQCPRLFSHRGISFSSGDLVIKACRSRETTDSSRMAEERVCGSDFGMATECRVFAHSVRSRVTNNVLSCGFLSVRKQSRANKEAIAEETE